MISVNLAFTSSIVSGSASRTSKHTSSKFFLDSDNKLPISLDSFNGSYDFWYSSCISSLQLLSIAWIDFLPPKLVVAYALIIP